MSALKPNTQRALNLLMFLWVYLGLSAVSLGSGVYRYFLVKKSAAGTDISTQAAEASSLISDLVLIVTSIIYVVCVVIFIMWFRRAYNNLHQLTSNLSFKEGWAVGGWFVPVISFYVPFKIMKEMYEETDLILTKTAGNKTNIKFGHLYWWWALWLLVNLFSSYVSITSLNGTLAENSPASELMKVVDSFLSIPLTLFTIKVVKDYAIIEDDLVLMNENENHEPGENAGIFTQSEYRRYL